MKIAFVSDIHGGLGPLKDFIAQCEKGGADYIVILGDALYHGPRNPITETYNAPEVAALLNEYSDKIIAIRGNCDSEVDQMMLNFPLLAEYSNLIIDDTRFFLCHGHLSGPNNVPALADGSVLASGHTHLWTLEERDGITFFNPGSIGLPKGGNPPSYGWYEEGMLQVRHLDGTIIQEKKLK